MAELVEVRFHGRGGQGAWTASHILAMAALKEGKYVQSFPTFGPEREGAPMMAFTRISEDPINIHSGVYEPDAVVVLDPTLLGPIVLGGMRDDTVLVTNSRHTPLEVAESLGLNPAKVWTVNATSLAMEIIKRHVTNTAMLGALVKAVPVVELDSLLEAVRERFKARPKVAELNVQLVQRAYEEVRSGG